MSDSGTGSEYTDSTPAGDGADEVDGAGEQEPAAGEAGNLDPEQPSEPKSHEEEEDKPPEPEPEPDPLEGLTYEDYPSEAIPPYGELSYWEKRYTDDPEVFEWYQNPDRLFAQDIFPKYVKPEGRTLVIGTGNSDLAPKLVQNGFEGVTAIDFARPCIVKSRRRNREIEGITWKVMDVRRMAFANGEFQTVIDKGTLDSIFFAGDAEALTALTEISRVLKRRGFFISISCVPPDERREFIDRPAELRLELETVIELPTPLPSDEPHYVYVVKRVENLRT
jgi:SAM-dependent methyltransferase